jgi:hypothetical protein
MGIKVSFENIKDEINQVRKSYPKLRDDSAFVFWFLRAFLVDSEEEAKISLTGDVSDKNIDAILFDENAKQVHVIQGKFHQKVSSEKRNDVLAFADLATYPWETKEFLKAFYNKLDPLVLQKFEKLVDYVKGKKYELRLYYVTTGKCSRTIINEANEKIRQAEGPAKIFIFDSNQVLTIFKDYIEGVAPAVKLLSLRIVTEGSIQHEGVIHQYDPDREIESWVFSMSAKDVGEMYKKVGIRLFARNVRGYLGDTKINEAMENTIENEAHNFWYYNNGLTIVCDEVKRETRGGEDVLLVDKAQVINGQQTTITLSKSNSEKANLLVKVIKIPRHAGDADEYDSLVNSIVKATNWQNRIEPADLVSNDYKQVSLERKLRKKDYQYIRKRMSKSEAKRLYGSQVSFQINKYELAQTVAACEFDPLIVRKGKQHLFEEPYYPIIFSNNSPLYYLSRYWLMRQVKYTARGYPERAYAKWLVLHFAWKYLSKEFRSRSDKERFRYACEHRYHNILSPLKNALDYMFKAALTFYRLERGKGEERKDVSNFFRLSKLHEKFDKFWASSKNTRKEKTEKLLRKFFQRLKDMEVD